MNRFKLITFDVYSALVDFEGGLVPQVAEALEGADAAGFVKTWRAKQLEYAQLSNSLDRGRIPFRTLTRRSLDHTLARARLDLPEAKREALVDAWDRLPAWPEAEATLAELAGRGYRLGLLSNGDEAMLRALARCALRTPFDPILASDHAGHYKPHPSIYRLPAQKLGLAAGEVLHVAGSGNDVLGARLAGLACAWSNRHGDVMIDPAVRPDFECRDLSGLLAFL